MRLPCAQSIAAGATFARWFGAEANRAYATLGDDPDTADLRRTLDLIRRKGGVITVRELEKSDRRFRGHQEEAEAELNKLVAAELGTWVSVPPDSGRGPPRREFQLSAGGRNAKDTDENHKPADADNADKPADEVDWNAVNESLMEAADAEEERWTL